MKGPQWGIEQAICQRKKAERARDKALEDLALAQSRIESLEEMYATAKEERDKYERKWRETLAVMEDAREMVK